MRLVGCIVEDHDLSMVLLAAIMCVIGAFVTMKLYRRAMFSAGPEAMGWIFLTAVTSGTATWAAHFIAMLGYNAGVPVSFDPVLTAISLILPIVGCGIGFWIALGPRTIGHRIVGGGVFGVAIAAMHYTGMFAYRVDGPVQWDKAYLTASLVSSVAFSALAFFAVHRWMEGARGVVAEICMILAILSLHFLGMTAFLVSPMPGVEVGANSDAFSAMAVAIAIAALIVVGTGLSSALIDSHTRADSREELRKVSLRDPLTGLPNRSDFNDELDATLAAEAGRRNVAVVIVDLFRFKELNVIWGHAAGDATLGVIAARLRNAALPRGYVARLGGDEFAVILAHSSHNELVDFVDRLQGLFRGPIRLGKASILVDCHFGIAISPEHGSERETLVSNAEVAVHLAKRSGRSQGPVRYYEPEFGTSMRSRSMLSKDLRNALEYGGLAVHYQVQERISTGEIAGFEALARWAHPELGNISPAKFIAVAEADGMILQLGRWVLRRACADAAQWGVPYKVAVNLSPAQLVDPGLPAMVDTILKETGLAPERLELELTETAVVHDEERSLTAISQIRALGVSIALDDFGTGYSSLDTLRTFPFDKIKIDRAFVTEIESDPRSLAIVRAVLALGKSLGIPVLAEGVETPSQLALLRAEGCKEAQGFLLGAPDLIEIPPRRAASQGLRTG